MHIVKTTLVILVVVESLGFRVPNSVNKMKIGTTKRRTCSNLSRKLSFVNSIGVNLPMKGIITNTKNAVIEIR